jgi:LuxR family maltose regulon positive regulatory protein
VATRRPDPGPRIPSGRAGPIVQATKLQPPRWRTSLVRRPRLTGLLRASRPALTLIVAPPGFGKTSLLADWADVDERAFAWVTVEPEDKDQAVLWPSIGTALGIALGGDGEIVDRLVASARHPDPAAAVARTLESIPDELVLVLDDAFRLRSEDAHHALTRFAELAPRTVQLVISTRTEPPLPVARLRATGELLELRTADLAFTREETIELLDDRLALNLDPAAIDILHERTEGWPAGLYLAYLSMRSTADQGAFVTSFGASNRHVLDYLMEQVLDALDAETLAFMLATSVVDTVCGSLADALTGGTDSATRLAEIERANVFITPLDERREWYRYHGLLAELLRIELRRRSPERVPELHRRAAQWFADRRDMDRAVRHAIAAGDSEQAARWIAGSYLQLLEEGRIVTVDGWLDAMGPEVVAADQRLAVVRAWTSHFLGRHADGDAALTAAIRAPAVQPMPDGTGSIEASAALIGAAFPGNDAGRMLACAERAFELEAARDSPWRITVHVLLGFGLVRKGSFDEARAPLSIGVDLALANEMWMDAVGARALLARISLETGETGRAEQLARAAVALAEEHDLGSTATGAYARATLGTILVRRGHATEAGELLAGALPSARAIGEPLFVAEALIGLAQARRMLGRSDEATAFLREADAIIDASRDPGYLTALRSAATPVPAVPRTATLSRREVEVLQVLATGASKRQAAARLFVSFNTIHTQLRSIYRKLDVHSLPAAISQARELNLID